MHVTLEALRRYVGSRIRELREQKGWTLEDLADASGIAVGYLGHIERGTTSPSLKTALRLAEALEVSTGRFFPPDDQAPATSRSVRSRLVKEITSLLEQSDTRKLRLIAKVVKAVVED